MVEEIVILDSETHQGLGNSETVDLYSQQLWCWGRDILRSEGNLLIEYEKEIQEQLGVEYRKNTLNGWDNGKRKVFPARQIIPMWIKIRNDDYEEL